MSGEQADAADLPDGAVPWLHDLARWIGTWCFRLPFRLRVHGRERVPAHGPVVLVANHSSLVDGPVLFGLIGRRSVFLVKHEMFRGPLGWFLPRIGQLAVRRGEADRAPLTAALRVLKAGGVVGVFPEGTRGVGEVTDAQHGAAWLARATDAKLLPVVCRGTRRPDGAGRRWRPRVDVLVGEPFEVARGGGRAGLAAASADVRDRLAALVTDIDTLRSRA